MTNHNGVARTMAVWSARHRRKAILGWLVFVLAAYLIGMTIGQRDLTDAQMGNGESAQALSIYEKAFPFHTAEEVLVQGNGSVHFGNPAYAKAVADLVKRLGAIKAVGEIRSPFTAAGAVLRSHDGRSMLVTFRLAGDSNQAEGNVRATLAATRATAGEFPQLRIEEFGAASASVALVKAYDNDFAKAEHTSLPITLLILLLAFGALVAAGVPLLLGMTAVLAALGLIAPLSHLVPVAQGQIAPVVLLIGLAVGVDYSMFYLRRHLEERRAGHSTEDALARAAATSGRAVLISGVTVLTAMAGMFLAGNAVFTSLAMGTMVVIGVAVLGSITVLPAVMSKLGDRIEKGRVPVLATRRAEGPSRAWGWIVDRVLKAPVVSAALSGGLLLVMAAPALGMRTVDPGMVGLPSNLPIMGTYARIEMAFPGTPQSALVVVEARNVTAPAIQSALVRMSHAVATSGQMLAPVAEFVNASRTVTVLTVPLAGNGTNVRSDAALATLRDRVIPATIGAVPGVQTYVGGTTASSQDFNSTMKSHLPIVFGFVLALAFLLLLMMFSSLVIPLLTIALNLLSVGAAYGVMVWIFQDGHLRWLIGAQNIGGVIDWIPLFLFIVLFGLSMDYHVLVLSRIREAHDRGLPTAKAVAEGIHSTAGIITSAAVVMIAAFSIFAMLHEVVFKQLGVALAAAVLIDATVVRIVLLPSVMKLLGEWNWYLPRRLPRFGSVVRTPVVPVGLLNRATPLSFATEPERNRS